MSTIDFFASLTLVISSVIRIRFSFFASLCQNNRFFSDGITQKFESI